MARHRNRLPQLDDRPFLTDGGIETVLIFHEGLDLPAFASFVLLEGEEGRQVLRRYFDTHIQIARSHGAGFVLESPTWRASSDWAPATGRDALAIDEANRDAIRFAAQIRSEWEGTGTPIVISGCVGPRGDGYDPGTVMTCDEAQRYHARQVGVLKDTEADLVSGITITSAPEAIGLTRAAQAAGLPVVVSFTVETDGRLPTGQGLEAAIEEVDAATGAGPAYYMVNCAHPTHFSDVLAGHGRWLSRIRGLRPNASTCSHAELDEATELDEGDPAGLALQVRELRDRLPALNVFGGCCGTDARHIRTIAAAVLGAAAPAKEARGGSRAIGLGHPQQ